MNDEKKVLSEDDRKTVEKLMKWTEEDWEKYRKEKKKKADEYAKKGILCLDDSIESFLDGAMWIFEKNKNKK